MAISTPNPDADPTDPGPDDSQDPANDLIEEQDHLFTLDDMNALFDDGDESDSAEPETDGTPDPVEPAEGGVSDPTAVAPPSDPPVEDQTTDATPDPAPEAPSTLNIAGREVSVRDVEQLVEWVSTLTPEQWAALNTPAPTPEPEPDPTTFLPPEDEIVDPRLAQWTNNRFETVEQKLDILLQQQQAHQQAIAAQREAELQQALSTARQGVAEKYGLTDAEAQQLLDAANNNPAAMAVVQQYNLNADPVAAFSAALDTAYWLVPEFRDRAIQNQVTTAVAERNVNAALESRKELNQGLVGSGAAAPRKIDTTPSTPEEHDRAIVQAIREAMSN